MLAITTLTVALLASIVSATATAGGDAIVPGPLKGACRTGNFTTEKVDLDRWQGAWYEMAHSKSFYWDRGCTCTTAEYTLREDNTLRILNTCRLNSVTSGLYQREANGRAVGEGKLKINFFAGLKLADADYQIIYVDEDYSEAVIVSCSNVGGNLVWIVSRTPNMSSKRIQELRMLAFERGFLVSDLVETVQQGCWSFADSKAAVIRHEEPDVSQAIPKACALPTTITDFPYEELSARWHILYTQPDFVENIFSHNCLCNTVTLEPSTGIAGGYAGTWRASVVCRNKKPDGKRADFVRPVYQISNLTSLMGHFTQKLYGGIANEHWQIIAHAEDYNHMLLYTCLDTKLFGPSYCLHIVGRERSVPQSVVDGYVELAKSMNLYKPDIMRPVFHGQGCKYDPMPASMEETVNEESMFRVQI